MRLLAAALNGKAVIVGNGETAYKWGSGRRAIALQPEASLRAIEDAGRSSRDIDCLLPYAAGVGVAEGFMTNFRS